MSSGFISESEATEIRKRRQEEWEKVRKADDPVEYQEPAYDHRSLYEKLQEQKQKKELEYEEAHKLKNMIKGLDDDEIEFLELVDKTKLAVDKKKELEEQEELADYRKRVAVLQENAALERVQPVVVNKKSTNVINSQQKKLQGVIVKKQQSIKRKCSDSNDKLPSKIIKEAEEFPAKKEEKQNCISTDIAHVQGSAVKCVAILPGLGSYNDSSSDDDTSESESESESNKEVKLDLLGRAVVCKEDDRK